MEKIKNLRTLNRKARKFLLEHCVSKRGAEIIVLGFSGHINSNYYEDTELIRVKSKWEIFANPCNNFRPEKVLSISGEINGFSLTRNTIFV